MYRIYDIRKAGPISLGVFATAKEALAKAGLADLDSAPYDLLKVGQGKMAPSLEDPQFSVRRIAKATDAV